jgi:hypothetical protein
MKTPFVSIALSLICTLSLADTAAPHSRADVIAEMQAAPQLPSYVDGSAHEMARHALAMRDSKARTRAEVLAELKASPPPARFLDGSDYEIVHGPFKSTKTREQVRAETRSAARFEFHGFNLHGGN